MNKLEIVVVGSGPSALATVRELVDSKVAMRISVVDPGNTEEPRKATGMKSHFGSLHMYDQKDLKHEDMKSVVWPSSSKGGFSRIWGAVSGHDSNNEFKDVINFNNEKYSEFKTSSAKKIIENYYSRKKKTWKLEEHRVAVNSKLCTMCGNCLTGCPTNAIWFAGDQWKEFESIRHLENFKVSTIHQTSAKLVVKSNHNESLECDLIFLAAGPIASAQILMRSKLIDRKVFFDDTQALFFPALRIPVKENVKSFALSQLSATLDSSKRGANYLQIYPDSRNLTNSIKMHKPIIGRLIAKVWRIVSPFVVTGIWYRDSRISPKLHLRMNEEDEFVLSKVDNDDDLETKFLKYEIASKILADFRIIPLFMFAKLAEAGESYHFGASKEIRDFNNNPESPKIKVVDASGLAEVLPGPITSLVMQNARRIVKETLRSEK